VLGLCHEQYYFAILTSWLTFWLRERKDADRQGGMEVERGEVRKGADP
jgi:hypothetical protein